MLAKYSSLKLIIEGDASPANHIVLFIVDLKLDGQSSELLLSDGWYNIRASLDRPLIEFAKRKRLFIGQKLHICNSYVFKNSLIIANW